MLVGHLILTLYFLPVFGARGRGGGTGGRASYPSSHGLSGTGRGTGYPGGQTGTSYHSGGAYQGGSYHSGGSYQAGGQTGTSNRGAGYPPSNGLSGAGGAGRTSYRTEIHHHHYAPPQHITYGSVQHPVYHGTPPVYVYEYRNSGSRFDTLLTGLALYNLGRMSARHDSYRQYGSEYRGTPGEVCKLAISRPHGDYEETRVDCRLMSSFIWDSSSSPSSRETVSTHTVVSQSVTSNGTTTVNTTVVDALQAKGPSIQVTPGMDCFMIRVSRDSSKLRKRVDCALLQEYALRSYNRSDALRSLSTMLWLTCFVFLLCK